MWKLPKPKIDKLQYSVPRNPNIGKIEREDVLLSGITYFPSTTTKEPVVRAFEVRATCIEKNKKNFKTGYLNFFNDGLVFLPDTPIGFVEELKRLPVQLALGSFAGSFFAPLGRELGHIAGELSSEELTNHLFDSGSLKKKTIAKAFNSKYSFCIPYHEITSAEKNTLHHFMNFDSFHITQENKDGNQLHYIVKPLIQKSYEKTKLLEPLTLFGQRIRTEAIYLAFSILNNIIDAAFTKKYDEHYRTAGPESKKKIAADYEKSVTEKFFAAGYSEFVFHDEKFMDDPKLANEILKRLSPVISCFNDLFHSEDSLIKKLQAAATKK